MLKLKIMISLGISPCPNDTFIFYALANKKINTGGLDFDIVIEDVETLNLLALKKKIDVTKVSCHAFCYLQNDYEFLRSGGALGRGCGPLLVARHQEKISIEKIRSGMKIAIPGRLTTAFLLLKLYLESVSGVKIPGAEFRGFVLDGIPFSTVKHQFIVMPFFEIMGAVRDGSADAGLIIHESRFTYRDYGLSRITDLGEWWERETGMLIPLGGIIAKKSIGVESIRKVEDIIRTSVNYSMSRKDEAMPYIKKYSQELSDKVIMEHVSLYVNDYTADMGGEGLASLHKLLNIAHPPAMAGR